MNIVTATAGPPHAGGAAHRDCAYSGRDFERITRMIYSRAGIALASSKRDMVYNRLCPLYPSYPAYE